MNDPKPKGGYQAVLQIIKVLGDEGPMSPTDLVPHLEQYGYRIENGLSPALSPDADNPHTYTELHDVLQYVRENDGEFELTEDETSGFGVSNSGESIYNILTADSKRDATKRAEISAAILLRLCEHDISTRNVDIPHAFRTFLANVWTHDDESSGRYQTAWNLEGVLTDPEMSSDWNPQKLVYCRQRAVDLGICREGSSNGSDLLYPVLVDEVLQAVVFHMLEYYRTEQSETTPNLDEFYSNIAEWYPVARPVYEQNVLDRGMLSRGAKITENTYPVLWDLLTQQEDKGPTDFKVIWLEGEESWNDQIPYAEFEIEVA